MSAGQGDLFGGGTEGNGGDGPPPVWREDGQLRRLIDYNFVQYASYVIRDRAIPDLDDGLKPVQRRILHSLKENDDGKFVKVANIVGHTMQYHPHGDASIADALVTLTNKEYLIEGQGNFGNLFTGDPAAASRYIECRLTDLARREMFNAELTRFVPSYDSRRKEPVVLPAKLPLLLMMGAEGIAVGLSTRVLPHNFVELVRAQIAILEKKKFAVLPDFRQGGLMDASEYEGGAGRVRLRAHIEQSGKRELTVRSVPSGTTTDSVIASIETAARKSKLKIKSIDDFTAEKVEIHIALRAEQDPRKAIQALYAFTQCEVILSSRIVVIHRDHPVEMNVEQVLRHNTRQLVKTLRRELESERRKLLDNLHDQTLLQIFVEHRIYKRIEECSSYAEVQQAVRDGIEPHRRKLRRDLTARDVEMLLTIKIKRISRYDMERNRKDIGNLLSGIEETENHLEHLSEYAIRYLRNLVRKYAAAYPRRTQIVSFDSIAVRDLTADELTLCYDGDRHYLGHEVTGRELFQCSSLDRILVVAGDGRYRVVNPPDKLFVDGELQHCGLADRERVLVVVFCDEDGLSHVKRFALGGAILNREYRCAPVGSRVLFASDRDPQALHVKYAGGVGQQSFSLKKIKIRGVKTLGTLMTSKKILKIHGEKPEGWSDRRSIRVRTLLD